MAQLAEHLLPTVAVAAVVAAFYAVATAIFGLVFALDDAASVSPGEILGFAVEAGTFVVGVTGSCALAGLLLDRGTRGGPVLARIGAPLVFPALGGAAWLAGLGPLLLAWSALLLVYWAVFLAQRGALRLLRRRP